MPEIAYTKGEDGPDYQVYVWAGATNGGSPDTFTPVKLDRTPYSLTVQVTGTFATGVIAIHGSLDGTNYVALDNLQGSAISVTAADIVSVGQVPLFIDPVMTLGGGTTNLTVRLLARFVRAA